MNHCTHRQFHDVIHSNEPNILNGRSIGVPILRNMFDSQLGDSACTECFDIDPLTFLF